MAPAVRCCRSSSSRYFLRLGLSSSNAELRDPLVKTFRGVSESMFKVTHMIMNYAPIGAFALTAVTVANLGFRPLVPLAKLVLLVYAAILFFAFAVLGLIASCLASR